MNNSKTIILTIAALVALAIMLLIIKFLMRKFKNKGQLEGKFKLSLGVWFATMFLAASIIALKAISIFTIAIDNIYKTNSSNLIRESAKAGALLIGLSAVWFIIWYFIVGILSITITGKRIEEKEIEADNYSYFIIRGSLLIGFTLCLMPIFEIILRKFIPSVEIPFYH